MLFLKKKIKSIDKPFVGIKRLEKIATLNIWKNYKCNCFYYIWFWFWIIL